MRHSGTPDVRRDAKAKRAPPDKKEAEPAIETLAAEEPRPNERARG